MTVAFTGHRSVPRAKSVYETLLKTIEHLIIQGADTFICGGALGFDTLAAKAVLALRERYPIRLILAIPCEGQDEKFSDLDRAEYARIRNRADEEKVLFPYYQQGCMHARNRYMVDHCDLLVSYCHKAVGGSAYTLNYAIKQDKQIIRL